MSTGETSPRPWTAGSYEDEGWIEDAHRLTVAQFREIGPGYEDSLRANDARLIVRCVNSHATLIEALTAIADAASCEQIDGLSRAAHIEMLARKAIEAAAGQADADPAEQK
jgi:hypothetical protein